MKIARSFAMPLIALFLSACSAGGGSGATSAANGQMIYSDTTWSGVVPLNGPVVVAQGATLTIQPGTVVKFKHYRGYTEPDSRLMLVVFGTIVAEGTAEAPIYFTSDAADAQNGDWSMVRLQNAEGTSRFKYCVFQFAQHGLNVWKGNVSIEYCVFRWNNWEGVYFESNVTATLDHCRIVENGYNGLAAEQFNTITMDNSEVWRNGTNGVHVDATTLEIRRSIVHDNGANGLSVDNNATLSAYGVALNDNGGYGIGGGEGANTVQGGAITYSGNAGGDSAVTVTPVATAYTAPASIDFGYTPDTTNALGYIPGDQTLDGYLYVYPDDSTRAIARKIGTGLGLTWSVTWDGQEIWTTTLDGRIYRLDALTGAELQQLTAPGPQPWGMTWDGTHLWIVDFAEKRISQVDPATGTEISTFATPDPDGGCKGVAWDGTYLNVMGWTTSTIYRMDRQGNLVSTITLKEGGGGGIAWDGTHFWVPGGGKIIKYDTGGNAVAWIYAASEGTWDLAWDGTYLWATQRTNENWSDAKIFALEILTPGGY